MPEPVVSVVVPAFRQASLVSACLDSIAAQTFRGGVEVLVVDDGCPEGTGDVARAHALGPRVLRQDNRGVAAARNAGIRAARGRYLAFLDADDRWLPEKLELQIARLARCEVPALCFCRYQRVDPSGTPLERHAHPGRVDAPGARTLFRGNYVGCLTAVVDRRCLVELGGFPESAPTGQDYALWLRIALRHPLLFEPSVLAHYVVHAQNRVGSRALGNLGAGLRALSAVFRLDGALCRRELDRPYAAYVADQLAGALRGSVSVRRSRAR